MAKFSKAVGASSRVYYFDVREKNDHQYLTITEMNVKTKTRTSIFIHPEHLENFKAALMEAASNVSKS